MLSHSNPSAAVPQTPSKALTATFVTSSTISTPAGGVIPATLHPIHGCSIIAGHGVARWWPFVLMTVVPPSIYTTKVLFYFRLAPTM